MTYETLILAEPTLDREGIDAMLEKVSSHIEKFGGTIKNVDEWGMKRLAYQIKKHTEGFYVLYEFEADGSKTVRPLEDYLGLQTNVMRFKTTVKPEVDGPVQNANHPSFGDRR